VNVSLSCFSAHLSQNLRRVIRTRPRIFVAQNFVSGLQVFIEDLDSISVVFSCFTHILSFSDLIRSLLCPVFRFASPGNCISSEHDGVCLWLIGICASLIEYVCRHGIEIDVGHMLCYLSCLFALARSHTGIAFTVQARIQSIDIPEFMQTLPMFCSRYDAIVLPVISFLLSVKPQLS
jgi:hypothetical protein